jgi:haloalkane dehalogenase
MPLDQDWKSLYPFASHELRIDGLRYHYLDEGAGEVLLMVHGNPTWSFYWRNLITALRQRYRVIAIDHIGCGLSDKPADYSYRLSQHIANLRHLVETLDLHGITLVGHDWGGAIGMGVAVEQPERFGRLILMNTAAYRSTKIPLRIRVCRTPILGPLAVRGFNAFCRAAIHMAVEKRDRMTSAVRAGILAPYDSWAHRVAIQRFVEDIPLSPEHPSYATLEHIEERLDRLRSRPMQLIWGMRDWCFSPHFLGRFIEFFPDAEVHRFDDAGHWVVEDAHERIVPLVERFLANHPVIAIMG